MGDDRIHAPRESNIFLIHAKPTCNVRIGQPRRQPNLSKVASSIDTFSRLYVANVYKVLLTHDNFILGQRIIKCLHTLDLSLHTKQIITKMGKLHKMKKTSNFADGKTNLLTIYLALMYCTCNQYNNVFN